MPKNQKFKTKNKNNQTKIISVVIVFVSLILLGLFITHQPTFAPTPNDVSNMQNESFDFGNQTISLDGQKIQFKNGAYQSGDKEGQQQVALIMNKSINPTGNHAAAIIVDSPGGSGTFYSLIGASKINGKEVFSNPIPLGDRIKITSVTVDNPGEHDNGIVTVKYMTRPENAPMSVDPTIEMSVKYAFEENGNLIQDQK